MTKTISTEEKNKESVKENSGKSLFNKTNYIIISVSILIIVIGFILMSGSPSTEKAYNPDIFSFRRTFVAPGVCVLGFLGVAIGILFKSKK